MIGFSFFLWIDVIISIVLGAVADLLKSIETRSGGSVSVDVDHLATLNILEKSHRSVARIVLHHSCVVLPLAHVIGRVLEDASLTIRTLGWVLKEILTNRCQILSAEAFLLLELLLAVSEATALFLLAVLARLTVEPELAQLGLDFLPPACVFGTLDAGSEGSGGHGLAAFEVKFTH